VCPRAFFGEQVPAPIASAQVQVAMSISKAQQKARYTGQQAGPFTACNLSELFRKHESQSPFVTLSYARTKGVQKGDIVKNALQQEAREDGIINFEKTKRNKSLHKVYGNFAGCPAELQHPQRHYFRHVLHSLGYIFVKFSSIIPLNFGHFKS
jgi:hypothetical protein